MHSKQYARYGLLLGAALCFLAAMLWHQDKDGPSVDAAQARSSEVRFPRHNYGRPRRPPRATPKDAPPTNPDGTSDTATRMQDRLHAAVGASDGALVVEFFALTDTPLVGKLMRCHSDRLSDAFERVQREQRLGHSIVQKRTCGG